MSKPVVLASPPNNPLMPDISSTDDAGSAVYVVLEKHVWTKEEGEMLLDLYDENRERFKTPGIRKIGIWAEIAKSINSRFGSEFSGEQCHQKLRNFKNDFHKVMMLEKKDCRHFERLHRIFLQSATKPSQSPAALKRKLTQLAGSKLGNTADGGSTQKKQCISLPNFQPWPILSKPSLNHKKVNAKQNTSKKISQGPEETLSESYRYGERKEFGCTNLYADFNSASSSSLTVLPVVSVEPPSCCNPASLTSVKLVASSHSLSNDSTYCSMSNKAPTMVCCSVTNSSQQNVVADKSHTVSRSPSNELLLEKTDIHKIIKGDEVSDKARLPVPLYYYSRQYPTNIVSGEDQATEGQSLSHCERSSIRKPKKSLSNKNGGKTALGIIRALCNGKKSKELYTSQQNKDTSLHETDGERQSRTESNEGGSDDISTLVHTIDKWRSESEEREKARIKRENEREKRQEERHKENLILTSRFVDLFEALLHKIDSSTE